MESCNPQYNSILSRIFALEIRLTTSSLPSKNLYFLLPYLKFQYPFKYAPIHASFIYILQ